VTEEKKQEYKDWKDQSLSEKAGTVIVMAIILAILVGGLKFCFGGSCGDKKNDCWYRAYEKAYCDTLVATGKGVGPCPMTVPNRCWEKEADYTRMGWKRGVEDAEKR